MAAALNKVLLALVAVVLAVAVLASAQSVPCTVVQCGDCVAGSSTQCAVCNPGFQLNAKGQCVTNVNAAAAPQSAVAAVAAAVVAAVAYAL
ncbi:hypothetical protein NESM_000838000 [Novymonas esmeraldas]|uniref:Surface antigen-like protein n=1 Tax=Novymonas esmeraldas TaxID=1808958 RepID=A0AAW0EY05_9TRYP